MEGRELIDVGRRPADPRMDAEMRAAVEQLLAATSGRLGGELPDAVADGVNAVASAYLRPPPTYEAEIFQGPFAWWGFSLYYNGERVSGTGGLSFFPSREHALRSATRAALRHRDGPPKPQRVALDLPPQEEGS